MESSSVVSARDAAAHLGLPVSVIESLRARRTLATKPRTGRYRAWHKDDVDEFLRRGMALSNDRPPGEGTVAVQALMHRKFRHSSIKPDIIAAVLAGRLAVAGRYGDSFDGLHLYADEVNTFIARRIESATLNGLHEAAAQTGMLREAIDGAIALGLLTKTEVDGRTLVTTESIRRFKSGYVVMTRVAQEIGSRSRGLLQLCRSKGIPFITVACRNRECGQAVLSRESESLLKAAWRARMVSSQRRYAIDIQLRTWLYSRRDPRQVPASTR
jgi:hypothetical protein